MRIEVNVNGNPLMADIPISNSIWKFIVALVIILFACVPLYLFAGAIAVLHLGWWYILVFPTFLFTQVVFWMIGFNRIWVLYGMPEKMKEVLEEARLHKG